MKNFSNPRNTWMSLREIKVLPLGEISVDSVITEVTSGGVRVSLWETSINSAITRMASRGLKILNSSKLSPVNSLSKSEFSKYFA